MGRKQTPAPIPPSLSPEQGAALLRKQYERGKAIVENRPVTAGSASAWVASTAEALKEAFGSDSSKISEFENVGHWDRYLTDGGETAYENDRFKHTNERLQMVEGLFELLETKAAILSPKPTAEAQGQIGNGVFLVHGHDEAVTQETARFLENLDLVVTILREQPNSGRTIIEKFIDYSNVGFAVVLLTADDKGGPKADPPNKQQFRARQNVILELGFFLGKLGRKRVCALYEKGVEIPSDYSGVLFTPLDSGWKLALAREMKAADLPVDLNKAF